MSTTINLSARVQRREKVSTRASVRVACAKVACSKVALSAHVASVMVGGQVAQQRLSVSRAASSSKLQVLAGRFETERTYIMIKPDGVQRGLVSATTHGCKLHAYMHACLFVHASRMRVFRMQARCLQIGWIKCLPANRMACKLHACLFLLRTNAHSYRHEQVATFTFPFLNTFRSNVGKKLISWRPCFPGSLTCSHPVRRLYMRYE
jgi:hypothetical protein